MMSDFLWYIRFVIAFSSSMNEIYDFETIQTKWRYFENICISADIFKE